MADFNITHAASWSDAQFEEVIAYLEGSGNQEDADQAREWRAKGEAGVEEWAKIEAVANTLSGEELARVGKGPHLLDREVPEPEPTTLSPPETAED